MKMNKNHFNVGNQRIITDLPEALILAAAVLSAVIASSLAFLFMVIQPITLARTNNGGQYSIIVLFIINLNDIGEYA